MGCQGSKATGTENQQQASDNKENEAPNNHSQQQNSNSEEAKPQEEIYVTEQEATTYVSQELGISEDKAAKVVQTIDKNDDGKIANRELLILRDEVNARKDAIRPKFAAYDKNNSGTVSTEEAYDIIKVIFQGIPESHVRAMVKRFDANDTGKMNFDEFIVFYAHVCAKREALAGAFDSLDKDESGSLAQDEIVRVLCEQCAIDEIWAKSLVEDFDQNKDGQLSKKEFSALFVKLFA